MSTEGGEGGGSMRDTSGLLVAASPSIRAEMSLLSPISAPGYRLILPSTNERLFVFTLFEIRVSIASIFLRIKHECLIISGRRRAVSSSALGQIAHISKTDTLIDRSFHDFRAINSKYHSSMRRSLQSVVLFEADRW